jgi:hypothetical protein
MEVDPAERYVLADELREGREDGELAFEVEHG